jgi:hypothetical protein
MLFALIPLGQGAQTAGKPMLVGAGPLDGSTWYLEKTWSISRSRFDWLHRALCSLCIPP